VCFLPYLLVLGEWTEQGIMYFNDVVFPDG